MSAISTETGTRPASVSTGGSQAAIAEHRRMEAAGELAQLVERKGKLVAHVREGRARAPRIGIELRQRDRNDSESVTRRCCAPSWRLRSRRRRSTSTGGDDPRPRHGELLEPGVELVVQTMDLAACAFRR